MRLVDRLYDWLAQGPTPDCDRILAAALQQAEPEWAERIVGILLRRGHEWSWATLIGRYAELAPQTRTRLQEKSDRMQSGIALAVKSSSPENRHNALLALEDQPQPQLAYLLSELIRDPAPKVRVAAARVLRQMADSLVEQPVAAESPDEQTRLALEAQRRQLVLALAEALRTFELHKRLEVLEASLWLARDLGETLWDKLTSRRSRAAVAVGEHLVVWNHPRLAHFLVSALKRPGWRRAASELLQSWKTPSEVAALLRESDLLYDLEVRQHLPSVQSPLWFTEIDQALTQLDGDLRPLAPRWVCYAGYRDDQKTALLSHWVRASDPRVHRAAVYALAHSDHDGARAQIEQLAASDSPLAPFARWCVMASDADLPGGSTRRAAGQLTPGTGDDFTMLWQACRRTNPRMRHELIKALRENADVWHSRLKSYLQSPDPRDRVLVLQIISTERLAVQFRHALGPLLRDPVEGIRRLAQTLVSVLSRRPLPGHASVIEPARPKPVPDDRRQDPARNELRARLEQLATGEADPTDADLIGRVRDLLGQVYGEQDETAESILEEAE